jgi:chitin disaccharide deacetylase
MIRSSSKPQSSKSIMNRSSIAIFVSINIILFAGCAKDVAKGTEGAVELPVKLVVNVDDLGMSPDAAEGAVRLWKMGAITSVSVMTFGEDFDHTVALLAESGVPTGVHLALNHGRGVLAADKVPSLHAADGRLWDTVEGTMAHLKIDEARLELEAQVQKLVDAGIKPKHLDSHMGLVFNTPALMGMYRDLAIKYDVALALPESPYFDPMRAALAAASLGSSVSLVGIYDLPGGAKETPENRRDAYAALLSSLKPGLNHLYSHPAPPTDAVKAAYGDYAIRNDDYALFMSADWKDLLARKNIELAGY